MWTDVAATALLELLHLPLLLSSLPLLCSKFLQLLRDHGLGFASGI